MRLSVCTISFRHHLISIDEVASWAQAHGFSSIELWGVHARNLISRREYSQRWLQNQDLSVSMISDYLPLDGIERESLEKTRQLCQLAHHWGSRKLRTFAGHLPSDCMNDAERKRLVVRLRNLCDLVHQQGLQVLVETHPNTLADTTESTLDLLAEVNHPGLGINFDVLHVWESGDDPAESLRKLQPWVRHFHLKNIRSRAQLSVFAPPNVYAASGSRDGMVPLFEGAFDYRQFITEILAEPQLEASLEWFGEDVKAVLKQDREQIAVLEQRHSTLQTIQSSKVAIAV